MKEEPLKEEYWTIEKVENGYLVKNSVITAVFTTKKDMWEWLEEHTI